MIDCLPACLPACFYLNHVVCLAVLRLLQILCRPLLVHFSVLSIIFVERYVPKGCSLSHLVQETSDISFPRRKKRCIIEVHSFRSIYGEWRGELFGRLIHIHLDRRSLRHASAVRTACSDGLVLPGSCRVTCGRISAPGCQLRPFFSSEPFALSCHDK